MNAQASDSSSGAPFITLGGEELVARQPVLALQRAGAAAEREAGDAGGRHAPAGGGEAVRLRGAVDVGPERAAADARDAPLGVDLDVGHRTQIEDDAVVAQRQPGDGVPAAPDRDRQAAACATAGRR